MSMKKQFIEKHPEAKIFIEKNTKSKNRNNI